MVTDRIIYPFTALDGDDRVRTMVIDVEKKGLINFGLARELAHRMGARYFSLEDLRAETLVQAIREEIYAETG